MTESAQSRRAARALLIVTLSALGYLLCARLSLYLILVPENIAAFWPPAGLLLGALLASRRRDWGWICLGVLPANLVANMWVGKTFPVSAGFSMTDTLIPLGGAWLIMLRREDSLRLGTLREFLSVALTGGVGVSAVCATLGSFIVQMEPEAGSFILVWLNWWTADLMGVLAVAPLCLSWYRAGLEGVRDLSPRKMAEGFLLIGALTLSICIVFGREVGLLREMGPFPFLLVPFLLWAALRFGVRMTSLACLIATTLAVTYTFNGYGPFASPGEPVAEVVFRLQVFLAVTILSALVVAVSVGERNRAILALSEGERLYRTAIEVAGAVPYYEVYAKGGYEFVGDGIAQLTGIAPSQFTQELLSDITLETIPMGELEGLRLDEAVQEARHKEGISWRADYRLRLPDGTEKWLANAAVQVRDEKGEAVASLGILQDITDRKKAEQTLRESERLYRSTIEGAGAVPYCRSFILSGSGERIGAYYSFLGDGILELTGYRSEEYTTDLFEESLLEEIVHESSEGLTVDEIGRRRAEQGGLRFKADYRIRHRAGEERWLSDSSVEVLDAQGRVTACLGILQDLTERKQSEEAVRRTDRLYRTAIEGIGAVPYHRDYLTEKYEFVGAGIEKLTGYTRDEFSTAILAGMILERVYYGDLVGLSREQAIQKARVEAGSQWRVDYRIRSKSGEERWVADSSVQVGNSAGEIVGALGILQDITDRVRAEGDLRVRDRAITSAINGIIITDWTQTDNPAVFVNPAFEKVTGYTSGEVIGRNLRFLQQGDFDQPGLEILRRAIRAETEATVVLRNYRKDGSRLWVELSIAPVRDSGGRVTHFIGIQNDITERISMERQQAYLVDGLRAVVEMADELLTCPDEDSFSRRAVELAREKLGLERCSLHWFESQSLVGTYGTDRHGNTVDERNCRNPLEEGWMDDLVRQSGASLQWYVFDGELVDWDGKELVPFGQGWKVFTPLHSNQKWIGAFFNDCGTRNVSYNPVQQELVAVYCSVLANIIERRRSEDGRLKLEGQIHHAQKLESLGVLAGGIAHDFNNLLMGVLGNASLAMAELPPESPARESVTHIEQAALRAAELAKQMLAYSGKGRFVIQRLDLSKIVEEMSHLLQVSISKKAFLRYNFAANLPAVEGDPTQIRQVIMNLITNASDAVGEKSGIITISTGALQADRSYLSETYLNDDLPEGYYVYVEVSDTGCGMDEETRSRIFDPFFTTKFTGRGLGLAAALGIVRGHKGAIKVYSEVGKGTTIKVLFPACGLPEEEPVSEAAKEVLAWNPSGTILLVDDEETVRVVCRRILEARGFRVLSANDGRAGVDLFRNEAEQITLVLLDMTMPHMDGEEAFREMRQIRPDVRVVLTSGYSEQDATGRFAGKGLAGFIQKPFFPSTLLEKIREVLQG